MLYITHLSGKRINRLWMSALQAGNALGYEVHLRCNMDEIDPIGWQEDCKKYSVICHHIDFDRNPLSPKNIKAYRQLKLFLKENSMDFIIAIHRWAVYWEESVQNKREYPGALSGARISLLERCAFEKLAALLSGGKADGKMDGCAAHNQSGRL